MACRPQDNPRSSSSDGVSPELEVLGLREALCAQPVLPVGATGLTGRRGTSSGCDRCDSARSSACVLANSASTKGQGGKPGNGKEPHRSTSTSKPERAQTAH